MFEKIIAFLAVVTALPAIVAIAIIIYPLSIIYRLICGHSYVSGSDSSGEIGLIFLCSMPLGLIIWVVTLYEIIKHVRISIV